MPRGRPPGRTAKSRETQAALYTAATELFAERGFGGTTMKAIADRAGVSPGLLYRYFPGKAAVVLELYRRLSQQLADTELPTGSWTERSVGALRASMATLSPHRAVLRSVLSPLLFDDRVGLLSPAGRVPRHQVQRFFVHAVTHAANAPEPPLAEALGRLADGLQLLFILFWLIDRSPDQRATGALLELTARGVRIVPGLLWLPGARPTVLQLDGILADALAAPTSS